MFSTLGLFHNLPCPEKQDCKRLNCVFSHRPDLTQIPVTPVPVETPKPTHTPAVATNPAVSQPAASSSKLLPAKRSISSPLRAGAPGPSNGSTSEPPRKLQRMGPPQRPVAVPSAPPTSSVSTLCILRPLRLILLQTGVPVLKVTPAQSQVPVPVRQVGSLSVSASRVTDCMDRRC